MTIIASLRCQVTSSINDHKLKCMSLKQVISDNVRKARTASGLTQKELAKCTSVTETTISRLERCVPESNITIEILEKLAKGLNIPVTQLVQANLPPRSKIAQQAEQAFKLLKSHDVKKAMQQLNKLLSQLD